MLYTYNGLLALKKKTHKEKKGKFRPTKYAKSDTGDWNVNKSTFISCYIPKATI